MLEEARLKELHRFIAGYSHEELVWINGYLSGIVTGKKNGINGIHHEAGIEKNNSVRKITMVFGTETGNSKSLATNLVALAKKKGLHIKLSDLSQYRISDLAKEEYFFVVISTQGEGEPPVPAKKFYDYIHTNQVLLSKLHYSVLALGDSSYPMFCKTGEDVDAQFSRLGAKRVVPLTKCDVDYEEDAMLWFEKLLAVIRGEAIHKPAQTTPVIPKKQPAKKYHSGTVVTNINLNDTGSGKQTYHIEISTDQPVEYEPGDTIGIVPPNRPEIVNKIINLAGIDENMMVETAQKTATVRNLLTFQLSICYLLTSTIKKYAAIVSEMIPDTRLDLFDLLRIYPVKNSEQFIEVIKILQPLAPRLYSVSSSPAAHGENEIHITVAKNQFKEGNELKFGLCSEFLGDLAIGTTIDFYIHKVRNFKLPASGKDIIMIGPGTGVAPFRSFLAERDATGATGKNWFFFGEQHFTSDFLYQTEIQQYVHTGVLTNIDLAFSRDQENKIYVQHRMEQKAGELYNWIDNGAYLYISGTKDPMSKDVEATLLKIIENKGRKTKEEAILYLKNMKDEGRYEKDVY